MKHIFVIATAVVALSACATVTRGTKSAFVVESTPGGAAVQLSNGMSCDQTPCSFKVPRKENFTVTVSKDGYETGTYNIQTQVSGGGGAAMAGNVILGGLIGAAVDAGTGAMLEHKPNPLVVTLNKIDESVSTVEDAVAQARESISEPVS